MINDLTGEVISDQESKEMIKLLSNENGILD